MFAICIESSHKMGMGHLFRSLNFIDYLKEMDVSPIIFINKDAAAIEMLDTMDVRFEIVDLGDFLSNWETRLINKYGVDLWINDRLDTDLRHSQNVKRNGIKLVTFDDRGSGAEFADIHVASMPFNNKGDLKGKNVLRGLSYLILNKDIARYKRVRKKVEKIIITLGGSDSYGVTVKVVNIFRSLNKKATLHIGPSFMHHKELEMAANYNFSIISKVPSLMATFYEYDLAVTGGGITPFEANASGLPCIIIANEIFEIENGKFLDELGSSVFAGYHENINVGSFNMDLDIEKMSMTGINSISLNGAKNVYRMIQSL